ncbi:MAG: hypothetical protein A2V66_05025 [Ignavibacteria bacterium RBG_13_36_8]|nr:MAG: hypothetical protein A2V66_05025 [Ignavibacteria bacterium RBG_13_36_8]
MKKVFLLVSMVTMLFGILAFQCSSTELTSAKLYINQSLYDKAEESLLKEIEKNPSSDEALYLLGWLNGEKGNIEGMLDYFNKSIKVSKKYQDEIKQSRTYHWATSFNKGVAFYNRATKATERDSTNKYLVFASKQFENAIICEPDSSISYENLAYAYISMRENKKAINPLSTLVDLKGDANSYAMLGEVYLNEGISFTNKFNEGNNIQDSVEAQGYYEKAISLLEKGRKQYPDDANILLLLSNSYINANKVEVAMDAFKAGVEKDPENKYYRYNYGVLLLNAEQFTEAAIQFNKAVEIDPEYINAVYNLGVTYFRWGVKMRDQAEEQGIESKEYKDKLQLALPYLEKYLATGEEDANLWDLMGKIYANLGMTEKSEEAFKKADLLR